MTAPKPKTEDKSMTGAVVAGGLLVIATVAPDRFGRMRLIKSRSGEIELMDRLQVPLITFAVALAEFLQERDIRQLAFVCSPSAGSHMASVLSYKIETVVQLMSLPVTLLQSSAVTVLLARSEGDIPGPDTERLRPQLAKMQSRAIFAALYRQRQAKEIAREVERQRAADERAAIKRERVLAAMVERDLKRKLAIEKRAGDPNLQARADARERQKQQAIELAEQKARDVGESQPMTLEALINSW